MFCLMFAKVAKKCEKGDKVIQKSVILYCFSYHHYANMTTHRRKIVVFDFDGTLTTKDTLLMFIHFAAGSRRFIVGFTIFTPMIILMKLRLFNNHLCKERLFSWFFKGMSHDEFAELGRDFCNKLKTVSRASTTQALTKHRLYGDTIYVVSASIEEWVRPYCEQLGIKNVLATKVEVNTNGLLTGRFASHNCYGAEKVRRLLAVEPDRDSYHLTAYGDSKGDLEMFAFADEYTKV